jgi:uncharacterized membrane protein
MSLRAFVGLAFVYSPGYLLSILLFHKKDYVTKVAYGLAFSIAILTLLFTLLDRLTPLKVDQLSLFISILIIDISFLSVISIKNNHYRSLSSIKMNKKQK